MEKKKFFEQVDKTTMKASSDADEYKEARDIYYLIMKRVANRANVDITLDQYEPTISADQIDLSFVDRAIDLFLSDPKIIDDLYEHIMTDKQYLNDHGQFFTPSRIADFMSSLDIEYEGDVLDPACGPGVFLQYVNRNSSNECEFVGIDNDCLMTLAAELRSSILGFRNRVRFEKSDYVNQYETYEEYDIIIGNPPYNRFQNYEGNKSEVTEIEDKYNPSSLANLYSNFFLRSDSLVSEDGFIVFLTPIEYLQTEYGEYLKRLFLDKYQIEMFVKLGWDENVFDAMTTLCVTVLRKSEDSGKNTVSFYVSDSPSDLGVESNMKETEVLQEDLDEDDKWTRYFIDIENLEYLDKTEELGEIADVKRGIATGYNDYFTLTESEVREHGLQEDYLKPVLTKAAYGKNYIFGYEDFESLKSQGKKVYLLYYEDQEVSSELSSYIEHGENMDANDRYLTRNRDPWYSMETREPAPILATVFSQDDMRFIYNEESTLTLAAFHGIYPNLDGENQIKALLAYLNSDVALELAKTQHREYSDGLTKFEPNDISELPILDIRRIDEDGINELSRLFDELDESRRSGDETKVRSKLNQKIHNLFQDVSNSD